MQKAKQSKFLARIITLVLTAFLFLSTLAVIPKTANAVNVESPVAVSAYSTEIEDETETGTTGETTEPEDTTTGDETTGDGTTEGEGNTETTTPEEPGENTGSEGTETPEEPGDNTEEEPVEPEEPKLPNIWEVCNNEYAAGAYVDSIPENATQVVKRSKFSNLSNYIFYIDCREEGTFNLFTKTESGKEIVFLKGGWSESGKVHYIYFDNPDGTGRLNDFSMGTYGGDYEPCIERCIIKLELNIDAEVEVSAVSAAAIRVYAVEKPVEPEEPAVEEESTWDKIGNFFVRAWNWVKNTAIKTWNWCKANVEWACVIGAAVVLFFVVIIVLAKRRR